MARRSGIYGTLSQVIGLAIVIIIVTYFFRFVSWIMKPRYRSMSSFQDLGSASTCVQGLKPCQEGYFCQQESCIPISPPFNTTNVTGYVQGVDL